MQTRKIFGQRTRCMDRRIEIDRKISCRQIDVWTKNEIDKYTNKMRGRYIDKQRKNQRHRKNQNSTN